ncbi:MAG: hypothetical protein IJ899_10005 [Blautia sp.]|nr:hypothetical protein [Blautia sp.]
MSKTKEVTIEQYREKLSSVCERASESTQKWIERHPGASRQEILDATYKITQAYGLAASTLAANKYDQDVALAEKQGFLKPGQIKEAEVWDPLGYGSIARAINGTLKNDSKEKLPDTIERMVKRFAEDTTLMNARRDGAEYAWIPAGDTCVFCLSLGANGWQRATRSTAEGNHADHIHPHCDCTFAVRFSKDTNVKGYHPEKIKKMIEAQEGDTWDDKLNSLRRQMYAEKKYGDGKPLRITSFRASSISEKVRNGEYSLKLSQQEYDKHIEGTKTYAAYEESRKKKGLSPQSVLTISKEEAQDIIYKQSGTGIIKPRRDGTATNIEKITCDKIIGFYFDKGKECYTNKAAIHHGTKGSHLVPIKGNTYD